jgi:hypothetical protein
VAAAEAAKQHKNAANNDFAKAQRDRAAAADAQRRAQENIEKAHRDLIAAQAHKVKALADLSAAAKM